MNHLCEMNFLVVVSVPFTTKSWLLLKGELLQDADTCIKCLTLPEVSGNLRLDVSLALRATWELTPAGMAWSQGGKSCLLRKETPGNRPGSCWGLGPVLGGSAVGLVGLFCLPVPWSQAHGGPLPSSNWQLQAEDPSLDPDFFVLSVSDM